MACLGSEMAAFSLSRHRCDPIAKTETPLRVGDQPAGLGQQAVAPSPQHFGPVARRAGMLTYQQRLPADPAHGVTLALDVDAEVGSIHFAGDLADTPKRTQRRPFDKPTTSLPPVGRWAGPPAIARFTPGRHPTGRSGLLCAAQIAKACSSNEVNRWGVP
jgi:hypothetical protein